jgi:uncharacterized membrane protein
VEEQLSKTEDGIAAAQPLCLLHLLAPPETGEFAVESLAATGPATSADDPAQHGRVPCALVASRGSDCCASPQRSTCRCLTSSASCSSLVLRTLTWSSVTSPMRSGELVRTIHRR